MCTFGERMYGSHFFIMYYIIPVKGDSFANVDSRFQKWNEFFFELQILANILAKVSD